jgi:hypothetical protein
MDEIKVGNWVRIKRSPYSSVKNGTLAKVQRIVRMLGYPTVYVLDGVSHTAFLRYEIERTETN